VLTVEPVELVDVADRLALAHDASNNRGETQISFQRQTWTGIAKKEIAWQPPFLCVLVVCMPSVLVPVVMSHNEGDGGLVTP